MGRRIFTTVCLVLVLMVGSAAAGWGVAPPGRATIEVFPGPNAINDALAVASPGDILNIHAGTYPERVVVRVNGVTLQSAGDGIVSVDGTCTNGTTLAARAEGVTVRGLKVVGAGLFGIEVDFSFVTRGRILDSMVADTCGGAEYGINVFRGGSIRIVRNTAAGFGDAGIYVGGIVSTPHGPLTVRDNRSFGNDRGIIAEDSSGVAILVGRNSVHDNDTAGIFLNNTIGVQVGGNLASDNGYSGIETDSRSSGNLIRSNTASGNTYDLVNGGNPNCWLDNDYTTSLGDISC